MPSIWTNGHGAERSSIVDGPADNSQEVNLFHEKPVRTGYNHRDVNESQEV